MITKEEIRIGNWLQHDETWSMENPNNTSHNFKWTDSHWYALGECTLSLEQVSGIPLTESWLERFGFVKATDAIGGWWSPNFGSNIVGLRWEFGEHIDVFRDIYWSYCVSGTYHVKAKYVHQLQNAIFVLLGKELELKP